LLSSRTNQLADHHLLHSFLSIHPSTSLSSIEKKAGGVRSLSQGINPGNKLTGNKLFRELRSIVYMGWMLWISFAGYNITPQTGVL
jgi:hypothetical protein